MRVLLRFLLVGSLVLAGHQSQAFRQIINFLPSILSGETESPVDLEPPDCGEDEFTPGMPCVDDTVYLGSFSGDRYLATPTSCSEDAPAECEALADLYLKWSDTLVLTGVTDLYNGKKNTARLAAEVSDAHAAKYCSDLVYAGYDDWFLPSYNEGLHFSHFFSSLGEDAWTSSEDNATTSKKAGKWNAIIASTPIYISITKTTLTKVVCIRRFLSSDIYFPEISDIENVNINTLSTTPSALIGGFTGSQSLTISGDGSPEFQVNGGAWVTSATVVSGDSVAVRMTSASTFDTERVATLTLAGESRTWTLKTYDPVDCENGNPEVGDICQGFNLYAGEFAGSKYMIIPRGCTNSTTPTCSNFTDTLWLDWASNATDNIVTGATSIIDGKTNTQKASTYADQYAVSYCADLEYGGYTDWYLPAWLEAKMLSPQELGFLNGLTGSSNMYFTSTETSSTKAGYITIGENLYFEPSAPDNIGFLGLNSDTYKSMGNYVTCVRRIDDVPYLPIFSDIDNAPPNQQIISNEGFVAGFSGSLTLSVSGDGNPEIQVNGGTWVTSASVSANDVIKARATSPGLGDLRSIQFSLGSGTSVWNIRTYESVDCTSGTPLIGDFCSGGGMYAGELLDSRYMVTPSGCTDTETAVCYGSDRTGKQFINLAYPTVAVDFVLIDDYSGSANSRYLAETYPSTAEAALYCENLVFGGYSDWFLPAIKEAGSLFSDYETFNLKKTNESSGGYLSSTQQDPLRAKGYILMSDWDTSSFNLNTDDQVYNTVPDVHRLVRCARRMDKVPYPLDFSRIDYTNVPPNRVVESEPFGMGEISGSLAISVTGPGSPQLQVNEGAWVTSATVNSFDWVKFRVTTPAGDGQSQSTIVTLGTETYQWDLVTASPVDCLNGNPKPGDYCAGTTVYAGEFNGYRYVATPIGCEDKTNPICVGPPGPYKHYGYDNTNYPSPTDKQSGILNTSFLVGYPANETEAAHYCNDLEYGGFNDWFLAAADEAFYFANLRTPPTQEQMTSSTAGTNDYHDILRINKYGVTLTPDLNQKPSAVACHRIIDAPKLFGLKNVSEASLNVIIESEPLVIYGLASSATISISGGGSPALQVDGGTWVTSATVQGGDQVKLRMTSSASDSTTVSATVTLGSETSDWTVTTYIPADCDNTTPAIGARCVGGAVFAGDYNSKNYMITPGGCEDSATPSCTGTDTLKKAYGTNGVNVTGAVDAYDGESNTNALIGYTDAAAALYCANMNFGGYTDWFLPSRYELSRFRNSRDEEIGGFVLYETYISSTQRNSTSAYGDSYYPYPDKTEPYLIRCVRLID